MVLEDILNDPMGGPYEWIKVLSFFWELSDRPATAHERTVLERAAAFHGDVNLAHMFDGPHRYPPDKMIRRHAASYLGRGPK